MIERYTLTCTLLAAALLAPTAAAGYMPKPHEAEMDVSEDGHFKIRVYLWGPGRIVKATCGASGALEPLEAECAAIVAAWDDLSIRNQDTRERSTLLAQIRGWLSGIFSFLDPGPGSATPAAGAGIHTAAQALPVAFPRTEEDPEDAYVLLGLDFHAGGRDNESWAMVCVNDESPCVIQEGIPTQFLFQLPVEEILQIAMQAAGPDGPPPPAELYLSIYTTLVNGANQGGGDPPDLTEMPPPEVYWNDEPDVDPDDADPGVTVPNPWPYVSTVTAILQDVRPPPVTAPDASAPDTRQVASGGTPYVAHPSTPATPAADAGAFTRNVDAQTREHPTDPGAYTIPPEGTASTSMAATRHTVDAARDPGANDMVSTLESTSLMAETETSGEGLPDASTRARTPTMDEVEGGGEDGAGVPGDDATGAHAATPLDGENTIPPRSSLPFFLAPDVFGVSSSADEAAPDGGWNPFSSPRATGTPASTPAPSAAGTLAATAAAVALAGATLLWAALTLYTRLNRRGVGSQATREAILKEVGREPGLTPQELSEVLGTHHTTVRYHLRMLEREKFVVSRERQRRIHYFLPGSADDREVETASTLFAGPARAIHNAALARPGLTVREASEAAGVDRVTVHYHVKKLTQSGLLRLEKESRGFRLFAIPAKADAVPATPAAPAHTLEKGAAYGSRWH